MVDESTTQRLARQYVEFMETGEAPEGLFHPDAFLEFTPPQWRLQAQGAGSIVAARNSSHPAKGTVPRWRYDPTPTGFVIEWEERWEDGGQQWYCREMARADVKDDAIIDISVYCTGDWDEALVARHAKAVTLIRP
jgi:hypothetical protein